MQSRLTRISGVSLTVAVLLAASCRFPYSFVGGGLDPALRTVAVLPFKNETTTPGLEGELSEHLTSGVRRLGLKDAPQATAHVLVTGVISRYEPDIPISFSADPRLAAGTRRTLRVTVDVTITDQANGKSLFQRKLISSGEYAESAESSGRRDAFTKLVNDIVQGVQSQW